MAHEKAPVQLRVAPRPIAPAPSPTADKDEGISTQALMRQSCQTCAKRKVKCDRATPACLGCRKAKLQCSYQAPLCRARKRRLTEDVFQRLARYEKILRQHGLLGPDNDAAPPTGQPPSQSPITFRWDQSAEVGKLLTGEDTSRYIDSSLWKQIQVDGLEYVSDEDQYRDGDKDDLGGINIAEDISPDPLTGAFMESQQDLLRYHPTHPMAMTLWETHAENVEPLCKILHIPSTTRMVERASGRPEMASEVEECLLFSIYHFAVFTMTQAECVEKTGKSRAVLLRDYSFAARQALVNASFLKTTKFSVLQALVLFLMPCRYLYDPPTFWILTGVAVRIGQRMGIHRDGEVLGLPPFEVEMRRRLFYQLMPLDSIAGQMSGAGMSILPDSWDTKSPLNINDKQIWPGMTQAPKEQKGATEMIFCLSRCFLGKHFAKAEKSGDGAGLSQFRDCLEAEKAIAEAEAAVEEKFIRYCDIVNPLHFLTIGLARAGLTSMRLRTRLSAIRDGTATDTEWRESFYLAQKVLDTDSASYSNAGLNKYRWHMGSFFLWGMWDSMILVLTSLWRKRAVFSTAEVDTAWKKVGQVYLNHDELLDLRRTLHVVFGRLTLKAWDAGRQCSGLSEPSFISTLRSHRHAMSQNGATDQSLNRDILAMNAEPDSVSQVFGLNDSSVGMQLGGFADNGFDSEAADWAFWDELIQDEHVRGD